MKEDFFKNNAKNYKNFSLTELVILSQEDDIKALEELVKREQNGIYATLCYLEDKNIDVLDLTQEILIKMSQNIKKIKKPQFFKSWLNQVIMHSFYDSVRKKSRQPSFYSIDTPLDENTGNVLTEIPDTHKKPEEDTLTGELDRKIKQPIYNLPLSFRIPIILRELQGMSYEEIAESMNTNIGTVKSRIARARYKLQEELRPYIA